MLFTQSQHACSIHMPLSEFITNVSGEVRLHKAGLVMMINSAGRGLSQHHTGADTECQGLICNSTLSVNNEQDLQSCVIHWTFQKQRRITPKEQI